MKIGLRYKLLLVLFILVSLWSVIIARPSGASSRTDTRKAKQELIEKGDELYQSGKYEAAKEAWQGALSIDPWNGKIKRRIKEANEKMRRSFKGDVSLINIQDPPRSIMNIWTLEDCIETAIKNHLPLQIAQKNVKLGETRLWEARRNMLPTVSAKWEETYGEVNGRNYKGVKEYLEGQHPLYHGGELWFTQRQAETNLKIVKEECNRIKNDLVLMVKRNYYTLAKSMENLRLQTELQERIDRICEKVTQAYEAHIASKLEYLNVASQKSQVGYQVVSAKGDVDVAKLIILQTMNLDPKENFEIEPNLAFNKVEVDYDKALRVALLNRPEIKINSMMIEYYSYGKSIAKAKGWPKIDIMGNWGLAKEGYLAVDNGAQPSNLPAGVYVDPDRRLEQQWYAGFKASMPVWGNTVEYSMTREQWQPVVAAYQGTEALTQSVKVGILDNIKYYSDRQAADVDLDRARQEFIKAKQDITLELKETIFAYEKALILLETAEKKLAYQERDAEIRQFKATIGESGTADQSGPGSDVIESLIRVAQEKFSYTSALAECHTSLAGINKAIGIEDYYSQPSEKMNNK
ncbi:MAG TPA: TolC family protein [Candidatus Omnitrophota bacterium]|nr:TolC family protein [Candidatus Omnitrophota bacterium]